MILKYQNSNKLPDKYIHLEVKYWDLKGLFFDVKKCKVSFPMTESDQKDEEKEGEDKSQPRSIRDRRRPREKRRSTGVSFWTQDVRLFLLLSFLHSAGQNTWCSAVLLLMVTPKTTTFISILNSRVEMMTLSSSRTLRRAAPGENRR